VLLEPPKVGLIKVDGEDEFCYSYRVTPGNRRANDFASWWYACDVAEFRWSEAAIPIYVYEILPSDPCSVTANY
jgi:hypothetical protein